jgi:endogenous inhibitor of DNA gyrase (YacG/DUF329 family)
MERTVKKVKCAKCGCLLEELPNIPTVDPICCPSCGSILRTFAVELNAIATAHTKLIVKARHQAPGKPFCEEVTGDDLHRKTGKWMKLDRIIDRVKNLYREVVTDQKSGEIVYKCEEPLSEHKGHGSEKKTNDRNCKSNIKRVTH